MKSKMKMNVGVLFSGGKDSCLALHKARQEGYTIKCLLSVLPDNFDSFMFHKPYLDLLKKQAEMLRVKLIIRRSKGEKEEELEDLKELIREVQKDTQGIVVGGIASSYQGKRIKKLCEELGLLFIAPLWDYDGKKIWKELLGKGFQVVLTKISCEGIPRGFLGKIINREMYEELRKLSEEYGFRVDFEGGEAESAVLSMPEFKKDIKIKYAIKSEGEYRHYLEIEEVE